MHWAGYGPNNQGGVGGYYHSIGLVEVVWKVATAILNFHLANSIALHGVLYGLQESLHYTV